MRGGRSPSGGQAVRSPQTREAHGAWESLRRPRGLPLPWREHGGASRAEETFSAVRHSQPETAPQPLPAAPEGPSPPMRDCASPDPASCSQDAQSPAETVATTRLFLQPPLCTQGPAGPSRTGHPGPGPPLTCQAPPRAPAQGF